MQPAQIEGAAQLDALFTAPRALVFKHSLVCPTSDRAFREYARFLASDEASETATRWIDVIGQRALSQSIAARTGIRHESPQAIVLHHGQPVWSASHGAITARSLAEATARPA